MKENSAEETIKTIEKMIKSYKQADECGLSTNDFKNEIKALEDILSDYKKLKEEFKAVDSECSRLEHKEVDMERENEELKGTLRDTQNSWFEDTKKIEKLKKENQCYINSIQSIVPVLTQDYIEKQKIKEVIKELEDNICRIKKQYSNGGENCNTAYLENLAQVKILKQILKESEEK